MRTALLLLLCSSLSLSAYAQSAAEPGALVTAEGTVSELYRLVSSDSGSTPNWDEVRSLFIDEAVVVLRTSRESTTVFTLEGFVADFVKFIERANIVETGFTESVVSMRPWVFGDMAHVLVLYEAHIIGSPRPPQQGVDGFQLIRRNGRWWIVSVTNEIPTADNPVPAEHRN